MTPDRMIFDKSLESIDRDLWLHLCVFARNRSHCTPTDADLAAEMGKSQQTIRRAIHRLEAARFIERKMDGRTRVIHLRPEGDGQPIAKYMLRVAAG